MTRPTKSSLLITDVLPISRLFPNAITIIALCVGLTSLRYAFDSKWEHSITLLMIAAFLDGMDGRVARYLNVTSVFGANLDSLADFINFGVAPAIIVYMWALTDINIKGLGWGFVLIYSVCCAARLARFNATTNDKLRDTFFIGVNAPMGAILLVLPMVLSFEYDSLDVTNHPLYIGGYMVLIAFMMASRIPTFSIKKISISHKNVRLVLAFFGFITAALIIRPWITIAAASILYIISIPISTIFYLKKF